jgi:hypothetical protein
MTAEHILQGYPQNAKLQRKNLPMSVNLKEKLFKGRESLKRMAKFVW